VHALDALAYRSPWRSRHPAEKAALALGLLGCAVGLPPWPGALVVGVVALGLLLGPARIPARQVLRAVRAPAVFIVVGSVPLLVAIGGREGVRFAPEGVGPAVELAARAAAALLCLVLFAGTTPLADVLPRLDRIGVPPAVTEIAALVYRLLFLLLESVNRVREAQANRLGFRTWRTTYRSVAGQGGAVFVRAMDRARRLEHGLALRGYAGSLRVQVPAQPLSWPFLAATAALLTTVVALTLAVA
jgi:cobalt/nickel transport system permease protein